MKPTRTVAGDALQGVPVADQADRPQRAVSKSRLLVLHPHRGGEAVPDPLPQEGHSRRRRGSSARRQRAGQGREVLQRRPGWRSATTGTCWPSPPTRPDIREYYLSVKDLRTGKLLETRFVKATNSEWAADNQTLFYVTEDDAKRAAQALAAHARRAEGEGRARLRGEGRTLPPRAEQVAGREVSVPHLPQLDHDRAVVSPGRPAAGEWKPIAPRQDGHEYSADHRDGQFYIRTNRHRSTNFKVDDLPGRATPPARAGRTSSRTIRR